MNIMLVVMISSLMLLTFFLSVGGSVNSPNNSEDFCLSVLPKNYDRRIAPRPQGKPVTVLIDLYIGFLDVDEATMEFRMYADIFADWEDPRLPDDREINGDCLPYIWYPNFHFPQATTTVTGDKYSHLGLSGRSIFTIQSYLWKVFCPMRFERYPFDVQACVFSISLRGNDPHGDVNWHKDGKTHISSVIYRGGMAPFQFYINETTNTHSSEHGDFYVNSANITLVRRLTRTIINYYVPSLLLVGISWITFWLQEDAVLERITLIMTALLTIYLQAQQYKAELPYLNYVTALDIWFFVCIFMLFAALVEFAFSYNLYRKWKKNLELENKLSEPDTEHPVNSQANFSSHLSTSENQMPTISFPNRQESNRSQSDVLTTTPLRTAGVVYEEELREKEACNIEELQIEEMQQSQEIQSTPKIIIKLHKAFDGIHCTPKLDSISKILFPTLFTVFVVVYWSYYLSGESK